MTTKLAPARPPLALFLAIVFSAILHVSSAANAKQVCGWYAIAYCSTNRAAVANFANEGWGAVINTNNFSGFARNKFCAVSGPQPKWSATEDRRKAIASGVSNDVYIKRACAEEQFIGD